MMSLGSLFCGRMRRELLKEAAGKSKSLSTLSRRRVIVVGGGWGGFRVAMDIDNNKFETHVVSPRNHFLFTPLLPSTAVGTLEFRAIQEPLRTIPGIIYHQASLDSIDLQKGTAKCSDAFANARSFELPFDDLVLCVGSTVNTFGVKGTENNEFVYFLKQLDNSRKIRNRLIECFERASSPSVTPEERRDLLTFVVVGGGPTSVEFAAELFDFLEKDVARWYPDLRASVQVKLVEATGHILGSFNASLVGYVEGLFKRRNIQVMTSTSVNEIVGNKALLSDGSTLSFGLMVWSTGVKQLPLIKQLADQCGFKTHKNGRLVIDDHLRVINITTKTPDDKLLSSSSSGTGTGTGNGHGKNVQVFALGDCAANETKPLPLLAQVAAQQGKFLANQLNSSDSSIKQGGGKNPEIKSFIYSHLGSMASVGDWKGVYDSTDTTSTSRPGGDTKHGMSLSGFLAFLLWRGAYLTKQVSIQNKILILMYWFKAFVFGRDISRF